MQSYFIFKGIDCRSMHVVVEKPPQILRGEERVERETIPGRSGELTRMEGEGVFNSYIQSVSVHVSGATNINRVFHWLTGEGEITFSTEPERKQAARVIGAITMKKHTPRMDWWHGELQFQCDPLKSDIHEAEYPVNIDGDTVFNHGDVPARPLIRIHTDENASVTLTVNGQEFTVDLAGTDKAGLIIDSEAQMVISADGNTNLTSKSQGEFPILATGNNTISIAGASAASIEKRVKYL